MAHFGLNFASARIALFLGTLGLLFACLTACSSQDPVDQAGAAPAAVGIDLDSNAWKSLPAAERALQIRTLQASAGREFAVYEAEPGVLSARHDDMGLRATFERGRVSVSAPAGNIENAKPIELAVTAWGCSGAMQDVASALPVSSGEHPGVSYAHPGFDEWYTVGPAGIEQGFTIRSLPDCAQRGEPLQIRLRFADAPGSIAHVNEDGSDAVLSTPGRRALHYGEPFAQDAAGVEHAVRITSSEALLLEVDASGAKLPLLVDPLLWDYQQKILAKAFTPPSFWPNDYFGRAVAVFGDTALIGSYGDNDKGLHAGAAYLFKRAAPPQAGLRPRFAPLQKLTASDAAPGDQFGSSVAISTDTAVIGAMGKSAGAGAAYVFVRSGTTWVQQQELTPTDPSANAQFGSSVALSGDTVIVGAPLKSATGFTELGAAYAFGRSGTAWSQQRKFAPPANANQASLHFGAAVATSGSAAAIGRDSLTTSGVDWFTYAGTWSSASTTVSSTVAHFGSALSMSGLTTAIGAYGATGKGAETGAVFVTSTSAPHALVALTAIDAAAGDQFGFSLSLSGSTLLIGAPGVSVAPNNGDCSAVPNSGAAYIFTSATTTNWSQQTKRTPMGLLIEVPPSLPPSPQLSGAAAYCDPGERLGFSVAKADALVLLGAPLRADAGFYTAPYSGAVFDDEYALTNGSPCAQGGDCFSAYCTEGVCCNSACTGTCQSCLADLKDPTHAYGADWVTGTCGEVTADTDPKDGCTDAGTFCGSLDNCSGTGSCKARNPPGTACSGVGTCATDTSVASNGICQSFVCASSFSFDCGVGYLCKTGVCLTSCKSNGDCNGAKGFVCRQGLCKLGAGTECYADSDCVTGVCKAGTCGTATDAVCNTNGDCLSHHCVDGVCCDGACSGACEACSVPGSVGKCSPVTIDGFGDPPGACIPPPEGSAGEGGSAGAESSEAGVGGVSAAGASGQAGASSEAEHAGTGGAVGIVAAGSAGLDDGPVECTPTCAAGLVCNHDTGRCQDELVTACGCRAAGGQGAPVAPLSLLLLVALGAARTVRRRRAA